MDTVQYGAAGVFIRAGMFAAVPCGWVADLSRAFTAFAGPTLAVGSTVPKTVPKTEAVRATFGHEAREAAQIGAAADAVITAVSIAAGWLLQGLVALAGRLGTGAAGKAVA